MVQKSQTTAQCPQTKLQMTRQRYDQWAANTHRKVKILTYAQRCKLEMAWSNPTKSVLSAATCYNSHAWLGCFTVDTRHSCFKGLWVKCGYANLMRRFVQQVLRTMHRTIS